MEQTCELSNEEYKLPIDLVQKCAEQYHEKIILTIDTEFKICIYIKNIDRIKGRKYLSNLEGRGFTYQEACIDFIKNLMDKNYNIRYKTKFYATESLRTIVRRTNFIDIYGG